jgi:hypothetical protein
MLTIKAKLLGIYRSNDYKNKETGEVQTGKTKLQLLTIKDMQDGSKKQELLDISIPDEKVLKYKDKVGQDVSVDVGAIGKIIYYGI